MTIGGPLFQLRWLGTLCPCLEKEEDKNARQALQHVNATGKRIQWMTSKSQSSSWRGFFGRKNSSDEGDTSAQAKLVVQENEEGRPEIFVDPLAGQTVGYKLNVLLKRVDKVQIDQNTDEIFLLAKPPKDKKQQPKELLRFILLQDTDVPLASDQRNLFVHHLSVLVEWERQRRSTTDDEWEDDDDEEDQVNFLQARAQKAAHFAHRELELQQTKRKREERKAKLVAESGGLKYTAIAMANRTELT